MKVIIDQTSNTDFLELKCGTCISVVAGSEKAFMKIPKVIQDSIERELVGLESGKLYRKPEGYFTILDRVQLIKD